MAAKYWPRKAATDEASWSCDAPAPIVTALPPEGLDEVPDGLCVGEALPWPDAEAPWPEGPVRGVSSAWTGASSAPLRYATRDAAHTAGHRWPRRLRRTGPPPSRLRRAGISAPRPRPGAMGRSRGAGRMAGYSGPVTFRRRPRSSGSVRVRGPIGFSGSVWSCGCTRSCRLVRSRGFRGTGRAIGSGGLWVVVSETTAAASTEHGSLLARPSTITADIHDALITPSAARHMAARPTPMMGVSITQHYV